MVRCPCRGRYRGLLRTPWKSTAAGSTRWERVAGEDGAMASSGSFWKKNGDIGDIWIIFGIYWEYCLIAKLVNIVWPTMDNLTNLIVLSLTSWLKKEMAWLCQPKSVPE